MKGGMGLVAGVVLGIVLWAGSLPATWGAFSSRAQNADNTFATASSFCETAGETDTVTAEADAWVDQENPDTNNGGDDRILVRSFAAGANVRNTRGLVRFPLPTPGKSCAVGAATLRLHAVTASGQTLDVYRADASWTEGGVTWNTQPSTTGSASAATTSAGWVSWDVTAQVQAQYDAGTNGHLVRHRNESTSGRTEDSFSSREGANLPELSVTWE